MASHAIAHTTLDPLQRTLVLSVGCSTWRGHMFELVCQTAVGMEASHNVSVVSKRHKL